MADFECQDHCDAHAPKVHPDSKHHNNKMNADHERSVGHPQAHSKGKMLSQLNPDHGPHK